MADEAEDQPVALVREAVLEQAAVLIGCWINTIEAGRPLAEHLATQMATALAPGMESPEAVAVRASVGGACVALFDVGIATMREHAEQGILFLAGASVQTEQPTLPIPPYVQ